MIHLLFVLLECKYIMGLNNITSQVCKQAIEIKHVGSLNYNKNNNLLSLEHKHYIKT